MNDELTVGHTPFPWTVHADLDMYGHYVIREAAEEQELAADEDENDEDMETANDHDEGNRRLVESIPDLLAQRDELLAACRAAEKVVLDEIEIPMEGESGIGRQLRAAIGRAEAKSNC